MKILSPLLAICMAWPAFAEFSAAFTVHPALSESPTTASSAWKTGVEKFGESLADENMKLRGYETYDGKVRGGKGLDMIAIKRAPDGTVLDVKLIEVKTGNPPNPLNDTQKGKQGSKAWIEDKLNLMHKDPKMQKLAAEVDEFCRKTGKHPDELFEHHKISTKDLTYKIYGPANEIKMSQSLSRYLKQIEKKARSQEAKAWAKRHSHKLGEISRTRMVDVIGAKKKFDVSKLSPQLNLQKSTKVALLVAESRPSLKVVEKAFLKVAGPAALVVSAAMDAKDFYLTYDKYTSGKISRYEFYEELSGLSGGIAGATAGASFGAYLGVFGGPCAWITIPVGMFVGGFSGYIGGAWLGSTVTSLGITWMEAQDVEQFEHWLLVTAYRDVHGT